MKVEKRGGLDVEAAGDTEEVQRGFKRAADWTLKQWKTWRKSKRDSRDRRIGLGSGGKASGSPKGKKKSGGLDFEAAGDTEEVQKGREKAADWTLKQRKARRKSKRESKERWIGR